MIGDDLAARLPELQAQAESMMRTPCVIRRPTGVDSDDNGADVFTYDPQPVYVGGCRVKNRQTQVISEESASSTVTQQQYEVHVPVSAGPFRRGDVCEAGGRTFRVVGLHLQTFQTAQRLPVEEVV